MPTPDEELQAAIAAAVSGVSLNESRSETSALENIASDTAPSSDGGVSAGGEGVSAGGSRVFAGGTGMSSTAESEAIAPSVAAPDSGGVFGIKTPNSNAFSTEALAINDMVMYARENDCSDLHITSAQPPTFRKLGELFIGPFRGTHDDYERVILSMINEAQRSELAKGNDLDFSFETRPEMRYRVNIYHQQNRLAAAIRILRNEIPTLETLKLPSAIRQLAEQPRGIVLVTGPTGSGKSTTLAAMIDYINVNRKAHIITIEDPIEYVHQHKGCLVHQRELHRDVSSFADALRSAMREDPDVILVGEMRDYETISAAVTAAETGHLVFSTLHTTGASQTIDRIVDVYPSHSQGMIRSQLSGVMRGIITQTLLPRADRSGRTVATEILVGNDAVLNLIREGKFHQLGSTMQASSEYGMHTLAGDLSRLYKEGVITRETAEMAANNKVELEQYLTGI